MTKVTSRIKVTLVIIIKLSLHVKDKIYLINESHFAN